MNELFVNVDWSDIWQATQDTLLMLGGSLLFTLILGLPLGVLLFLTGPRQLLDQPAAYRVIAFIVNVLRSIPFVILLIVLIPFTTWLVGTSLGVLGAIPPLVIGAAPFFARLVETALREVDRGIIEATQPWAPARARLYLAPCCPKRAPAFWPAPPSPPSRWFPIPRCRA